MVSYDFVIPFGKLWAPLKYQIEGTVMFLIFFMRTREREAEVVTEQYVECLGCFECLNVFELTMRTHHLKKSYEAIRSVVKIDIRIYPTKFKPITIRFILHNADR